MAGSQLNDALKAGKGDKRQIFKTAADVFARKGYHQTTVDEIAQAIGVAKGTIYNHFENKEDLYLAVIENGVNNLKEGLQEAVAGGATAPDRIKRLIGYQLGFYEEEKELVYLFLTELFTNDKKKGLLATRKLTECLQVIRSVIEEGVAEGSLEAVDPEVATTSLFGMVTISALHYLSYFQPIPKEKVAATIEQIFFKGIGSFS